MNIKFRILSSCQKRMIMYQGWKTLSASSILNHSLRYKITHSKTLSTNNPCRGLSTYKEITSALCKNTSNNTWCCKNHIRLPFHRLISTSFKLQHGDEDLKDVPETVRVIFISKDGTEKEVMGKVGERAMYLAHRKGIDMEGACEASLACTTCHCYIDSSDEHWDLLPEASEKEEDLLDMAPFLGVNSRLGCQIILAPEIDGIVLKLPRATKNFYVDGHKPEPH